MKFLFIILLGLNILYADLLREAGNNTVSDSETKLQWQDNITNYDESGAGNSRYWKDSVDYCDNLSLGGHDDWRLPSVSELISITDDTLSNPAMSRVFANTSNYSFWTSTTKASNHTNAFAIRFSSSSVGASKKSSNKLRSRCVRSTTN